MAEQLPREWREKIVHANLTVDDTELVGADAFPGQYQRPQGFYVLLELSGPERTEQIFRALAQDGVVLMPLQRTFWSTAFGVVIEQFGIPWEISCRHTTAGDTPPEP